MPFAGLPHLHKGAGAPLVIFPGLTGRRGVPLGLARLVRGQEIGALSLGREVWSVDRRLGLSPTVSIEDLARDYADAITEAFSGPVDVVGVSTGGSIALQLAADRPELVKRIVLVSSAHRLSEGGRQTQARVAALLRTGRERRAAAVFLANTGSSRPARGLRYVLGGVLPTIVVGRRDRDLLAILDAEDGFDIFDRLREIAQPTLVIGGARDRFYSGGLFAATQGELPNGSVRIIPRAGHVGLAGNRRLTREIAAFLRDD